MVNELEPLDLVALDPYDKKNPETMAVLRPLQQQVRDHGLWAAHLKPELGGQGYGQVKLALLNEIVGRSRWAPSVFGSQAPDSGNAEILALFGTPEQKTRYLATAARRRDHLVLLHDRTARRFGSGSVRDPRRTRRRLLGHQRREMVFHQRPARHVLHRHGGHQPRGPHPRQDVVVHRPRRNTGRRDHPQRGRRHGVARHARLRRLHRRPGAGRPHPRRRGTGFRDRADPAGRRAYSSRDAHYRVGPASIRHDV